eukprot:CAMPEP_0114302266 /NCGR_PEP_ID=MMETSP0059-20121206/14566_1 /TAXON_ID=36894 /ORGANISM="Pyramimonas parkeae, Strain CCMP726" /LENGTH=198 /DNA_ID=CAMNT_0001425095 /DNA_START=212 /DNA_END=810 /DNA_ORIENTATION=-
MMRGGGGGGGDGGGDGDGRTARGKGGQRGGGDGGGGGEYRLGALGGAVGGVLGGGGGIKLQKAFFCAVSMSMAAFPLTRSIVPPNEVSIASAIVVLLTFSDFCKRDTSCLLTASANTGATFSLLTSMPSLRSHKALQGEPPHIEMWGHHLEVAFLMPGDLLLGSAIEKRPASLAAFHHCATLPLDLLQKATAPRQERR